MPDGISGGILDVTSVGTLVPAQVIGELWGARHVPRGYPSSRRQIDVRSSPDRINAIRAHMAEFGIVAPQGRSSVDQLVGVINDTDDERIPALARTRLVALRIQLDALREQIRIHDRRLAGWHRTNETSRRLDAIPGVGPALATALVAAVADPLAFRSRRDFSAWVGLVPKQNSSGGKEKLGCITKAGDQLMAHEGIR